MYDLLVHVEGVSPDIPPCQQTQLFLDANKTESVALKDVRMMFSVGSLLPTSSNFEDCMAFNLKDLLSVQTTKTQDLSGCFKGDEKAYSSFQEMFPEYVPGTVLGARDRAVSKTNILSWEEGSKKPNKNFTW